MRDYGLDVEWKAGDTAAFLVYNRLCREQALAAFAARQRGETPMVAYYMASGTVAGHIANVMAEGR